METYKKYLESFYTITNEVKKWNSSSEKEILNPTRLIMTVSSYATLRAQHPPPADLRLGLPALRAALRQPATRGGQGVGRGQPAGHQRDGRGIG